MNKHILALIIAFSLSTTISNISNIKSTNLKRKKDTQETTQENKKRKLNKVKDMSIEEAIETLKKIIDKFDSYESKDKKLKRAYKILKKLQKEFTVDLSYILAFLSDNYDFSKSILEIHSFDKEKARESLSSIRATTIKIKEITKGVEELNIYKNNKYPIHIAIDNNNMNTVKSFLDYSPNDIRPKSYKHQSVNLLIIAIYRQKWDLAKLILERYNSEDIIHVSSLSRRKSSLESIITAYASKNSSISKMGKTLLKRAIKKLDFDNQDVQDHIASFLPKYLNNHLSVRSKQKYNKAFIKLIKKINNPQKCLKALIRYNLLSYNQLEALIDELNLNILPCYDNKLTLFWAISENNINFVKYIIEKLNFNINTLNINLQNGLHLAKSVEMAKFLLENNFNIKQQDKDGCIPFVIWLEKDNSNLHKFILDKILNQKIDLEILKIKDYLGKNILHYFEYLNVRQLDIEEPLLKFLLNHNSKEDKDKSGYTPLEYILTKLWWNSIDYLFTQVRRDSNQEIQLKHSLAKCSKNIRNNFYEFKNNDKNIVNIAVIENTKLNAYNLLVKEAQKLIDIKNMIISQNNISLNIKNKINQDLNKYFLILENLRDQRVNFDITRLTNIFNAQVNNLGEDQIYKILKHNLSILINGIRLFILKHKYKNDNKSFNLDRIKDQTTEINKIIIENEITENTINQTPTETLLSLDLLSLNSLIVSLYLNKKETVQLILSKLNNEYINNIIKFLIRIKSEHVDDLISCIKCIQVPYNGENSLTPLDVAIIKKNPNAVRKILALDGAHNLMNLSMFNNIYNKLKNIRYTNEEEKEINIIISRHQVVNMLMNKLLSQRFNKHIPDIANHIASFEEKPTIIGKK